MRAIAIDEFGGPEKLHAVDLPRPAPEPGEILIRIVSAGVNPVDFKIREGALASRLPHAFPLIPGWDAAGVVEALGVGAIRFRKGDRVWTYARKPTVQWGCYAEYVAVPETSAGPMPTRLLYEEAAGIPLAGLTAFQCLFDRPGVGEGSRVLIHGAAGGVGHLAVQLARSAGAEVYGTSSAANAASVMEAGARLALDYTAEDVREAARRHVPDGFDLVLDAVGGETLELSYDLVRPGGRLVGIVDPPDERRARERGFGAEFVFVRPDADQLGILARLVDERHLEAHVRKIYPLAAAADAQREIAGGHGRGKLVLNL